MINLFKEGWKYDENKRTFHKDIFELKTFKSGKLILFHNKRILFEGFTTLENLNLRMDAYNFEHLNILGYRAYRFKKGPKCPHRTLKSFPGIFFIL